MSFSFTAAGHRHDVIASLKSAPTYGNELGTRVRDAIIGALEEDEGKGGADGIQLVYVVKAYGHSGSGRGSSLASLTATVESFYQTTPAKADVAEAIAEDVASEARSDAAFEGVAEEAGQVF